MTKLYRAANVVIVTTIDGVQHIYHFAKDLVVHGGISFYGLIVVRGSVTFNGGGAGGGSNIIGSLLAGQSAQADTLGGSAQFQFDSCALANAQAGQAPHVLSTREIEY